MQAFSCSRPFASQAQPARAAIQGTRVGLLPHQTQHRQPAQLRQAHAVLSFSGSIKGCSCNSFAGSALPISTAAERRTDSGSPRRQVTRMGNPGDRGPFAPIVKYLRGIVGKKQFNKLRGKAISLHSQVIKDFSMKYLGASSQLSQGLIRTAKKNGERLGFLA